MILNLNAQRLNRFSGMANFLLLLYVTVTFYYYLMLSIGTPICFDDCIGYLALTGKEGSSYLYTLIHMWRPWVVPVFFAFFGQYTIIHALQIIITQTLICFFAWILFSYSLSRYFNGVWKIIAFVLTLNLCLAKGAYHYNQVLLSDSIGLSSVLLYLSFILWTPCFFQKLPVKFTFKYLWFEWFFIMVYMFLLLIVIGTRDANRMIVILGTLQLLFINKKSLSFLMTLSIMLVMLFALGISQNFAASRQDYNMENVMVGIILPSKEIRDYFSDNGMPAAYYEAGAKMQKQELDKIDITKILDYRKMYDSISITPSFIPKARILYLRYLISHPAFILKTCYEYKHIIFEQYKDEPEQNEDFLVRPGDKVTTIMPKSIKASIVDYFNFITKLLCCFLLFIILLANRRNVWKPTFFAVVGLLNAIGAFLADVWEPVEMTRHALIGSILFDVGFQIFLIMFLQFLVEKKKNTLRKNAIFIPYSNVME